MDCRLRCSLKQLGRILGLIVYSATILQIQYSITGLKCDCFGSVESAPPALEHSLSFDPPQATKCTDRGGSRCRRATREEAASAPLLGPCDPPCGPHAKCFLGRCMCHPGYDGPPRCNVRLRPANSVYTAHCPNLDDPGGDTLDIGVSASGLSDGAGCEAGNAYDDMGTGVSKCAYQCYSHRVSGVPQIPLALWRAAQEAESGMWKSAEDSRGDRVEEHHEGFDLYRCFPNETFGDVIEVGAGPWTQSRSMFERRTDLAVRSFTVFEPAADFYVKNVKLCAYKTGRLESYAKPNTFFDFPVRVVSEQGELLTKHRHGFDTVVSINVLEHVQDAYDYLTNLYEVLKPGGILVFHDRYYRDLNEADLVLGENPLHPIRIFRPVLDHFLSGFEIIYNNCDGTTGFVERKAKEMGYYVIARKKGSLK